MLAMTIDPVMRVTASTGEWGYAERVVQNPLLRGGLGAGLDHRPGRPLTFVAWHAHDEVHFSMPPNPPPEGTEEGIGHLGREAGPDLSMNEGGTRTTEYPECACSTPRLRWKRIRFCRSRPRTRPLSRRSITRPASTRKNPATRPAPSRRRARPPSAMASS